MAIRLNLKKYSGELFCASKWWGDPDMPADMEYPTIKVTEDGETYEYPLNFLCQINCEDMAPYDKDNLLPHEGMLYFFAALDNLMGYETPYETALGLWKKGLVAVKYAKTVNMETFESYILTDEQDNPVTQPPLKIEFAECAQDDDGLKLLGEAFFSEVRENCPGMLSLLQIDAVELEGTGEMQIYDCGMINILIKPSDLGFGNWKKACAYMCSL